MSKFHSTVSRRDFMKVLGLSGVGAGVATAAMPVFHDIDEMLSTEESRYPNPWWVKERELFDPTVPIDWDLKWRIDGRDSRIYTDPESKWYFNAYSHEQAKIYADYAEKEDPNFKWGDPRRMALEAGCSFGQFGNLVLNSGTYALHSYLGHPASRSPEIDGYAKWEGTPEENLKLLRGAVRFFGGDDVGVMEHDTHLDRVLCTYDMNGYKNSFEDIDKPYQTHSPKVTGIPNSYEWMFVWTLRQPMDETRRQQGGIMRAYPDVNPYGEAESVGVWRAYSELAIVENRLQLFLLGLGYHGIAGGMNAITAGNSVATVAGCLEHSRMGQVAIHPKFGSTIRGTYKMMTNLPLAPTKPIDAGLYEFCKSCEICAEHCPTGIIQRNQPTWTTGRNPENGDDNGEFGEPLPYQSQGFLGWRTDIGKCPHCPVCQGTCPFNELPNASWIHSFVKATSATTPIFNGFFANMDRTFEYGRKPYADYWKDFDVRPTYGIDTTR
ncbi:reductive dehalogenase [Dehalogenimonas lykanthroporepellens BL-DC-9]|nr:reductive dehalogenase [Dehalogenimonas lykanthroporepellens BL-DC-9]